MGLFKLLDSKTMWLTWIHHNRSPKLDRERLQMAKLLHDRNRPFFIIRLTLDGQVGVGFMQQQRSRRP